MEKQRIKIIAEAGVNHNGNKNLAIELIDIAAEAGADYIKFQTFNADILASRNIQKTSYQSKQLGTRITQHEMLKSLELRPEWHDELINYADSKNICFISTAFDQNSLNFLENFDLPIYKIPSGELTNGPLLWKFAKTGKPLILSTGMATISEVEEALAIISHAYSNEKEPSARTEAWPVLYNTKAQNLLRKNVTLLHCTSQYPTPMNEVNLLAMKTLHSTFKLPVGYSDHTSGIHVPIAAAALGACIIEKHITTDKNLIGPDHASSLEPHEFSEMVTSVHKISCALGNPVKCPQIDEWETRSIVRQKVVAARDIQAGQILTRTDLTTSRSSDGISAMELWSWIGKPSPKTFKVGTGFDPL